MNTLILLLVIFVIAIVIRAAFKGSGRRSEYPYTANPRLMTPAELAFFGLLVQAVEERGLIFGKVRVADVMKPMKGLD